MDNNKSYRQEISHIIDKAKQFDLQLQKIKELNQELIAKSEIIVTSLNRIVVLKTNKCTVCYTRERRVVFQPCGHLFCESCADRATTRNKCFTCRGRIENVSRAGGELKTHSLFTCETLFTCENSR